MQQVLIHVIPIFFALYAFKSLFGKTRFHWAAKILIGSVMLIASQYPGLARSFFGNHDQEIPYLGILLLSWLFATQLLMILMAFIKDFFFVIAKVAFNRPIVKHATTGIIITSIATALATWGTYEALRIPPVYTIEVPIKHLPKAFDGFTIAQLSDLHASALLNRERLEKVVEKTNALNADLIVITGDIVDGRVQSRLNDVMPISKLSAPYGVIGIEGNHEHYVDYDGWMKTLPTLGIKMLHNEHVIININGEKLAIIGINDPMAKRYKREMPNLKKALRGVKQQTPKILLSHQIKFSHEYAKEGIDLQLSGHTHGGQIFGMHWIAQMLNTGFVRDAYDVDGMKLYVNRGTGLWYGFPIRLGIGSEITLLTLVHSN